MSLEGAGPREVTSAGLLWSWGIWRLWDLHVTALPARVTLGASQPSTQPTLPLNTPRAAPPAASCLLRQRGCLTAPALNSFPPKAGTRKPHYWAQGWGPLPSPRGGCRPGCREQEGPSSSLPAKPRALAGRGRGDSCDTPGPSPTCALEPAEDQGWGEAARRPGPAGPGLSPRRGRRCRRCPPRSCSRPGSGAGWQWRCSHSSCLPRWSLQGQTGAVRGTGSTWAGWQRVQGQRPPWSKGFAAPLWNLFLQPHPLSKASLVKAPPAASQHPPPPPDST